jgi:hypothetical protein
MVAIANEPKFPTGHLVATPGALAALTKNGQSATEFLSRHVRGDWGDVPPEDARENELSVAKGFRILSAYELNDGTRIWVLTEADRSTTCVLLPEEY